MSLELLRACFGWCTLIDLGILIIWFAAFAVARPAVFRVHSLWFDISEQRFNEIHYASMAYFKLTIFVFNLVPYLALRILA